MKIPGAQHGAWSHSQLCSAFDPDLDFTIYTRKTDKNQHKLAFIFSGVQPETEKHMNDVLSPTDSTTVMCLKILDNLQKAKQKQLVGFWFYWFCFIGFHLSVDSCLILFSLPWTNPSHRGCDCKTSPAFSICLLVLYLRWINNLKSVFFLYCLNNLKVFIHKYNFC